MHRSHEPEKKPEPHENLTAGFGLLVIAVCVVAALYVLYRAFA